MLKYSDNRSITKKTEQLRLQGNDRMQGLHQPQIISVSSGKGGVGKTLSICNFARTASKCGLKSLILDGDMGMSNVDVVLGLEPRYNINDVMDGHIGFDDIILKGPYGIDIIPTGSGIYDLHEMSMFKKEMLLNALRNIRVRYDCIFIDTGAGVSDYILHFNSLSDRNIVITTPEPTAMTDAYALIKILSEKIQLKAVDLVVNMTKIAGEGKIIAERIHTVAQRFLNVNVHYLGHVASDPSVSKLVLERDLLKESSYKTIAGQCWNQIGLKLIDSLKELKHTENTSSNFWANFIKMDSPSASHL